MDNNMLLRVQDLVENPTPPVPICLYLDTSGSMGAVEGDCVPTGETIFEDGREWNIHWNYGDGEIIISFSDWSDN